MSGRIKALFVGSDGRALWGTDHPGITATMLRIARESLDPGEVAELNRALTGPRVIPDQLHPERRVEFWVGGPHPEAGGECIFKSQDDQLMEELTLIIEEGRDKDVPTPPALRNVRLVQCDLYASPYAESKPLPDTSNPTAVLAAIKAILDSGETTPAEAERLEALTTELELIPDLEASGGEAKAECEEKRKAEEAGNTLRSAESQRDNVRRQAVEAQNALTERAGGG